MTSAEFAFEALEAPVQIAAPGTPPRAPRPTP